MKISKIFICLFFLILLQFLFILVGCSGGGGGGGDKTPLDPLDDWKPFSKTITNNVLNDVKYINGSYVILGNKGALLFSSDGVKWDLVDSGTSLSLNAITYVNGTYIVVGDNGTIRTSTDGLIWKTQSSGVSFNLNAVSYGAGTFVVVGNSGTILTSSDAISWNLTTSGIYPDINDITYGNNTFVATGLTTVLTSPDGVTWTPNNAGDQIGQIYSPKILFLNDSFYMVATKSDGGAFLTSKDGIEWTSNKIYTTYRGYPYYNFNSITYANGTFLITGQGTPYRLFSSTDGINWSYNDYPFNSKLIYGNGIYIAISGSTIFSSADLSNWTISNLTNPDDSSPGCAPGTILDIAFGNNTFVVITSNIGILVTSDGITWKTKLDKSVQSVNYLNSSFMGFGNNAFHISSDGLTWTEIPQTINLYNYPIVYGNGTYLAVGVGYSDKNYFISFDGLYWTTFTLGYPQLECAAYGNGGFVAVGDNGTIITSPDGNNWTSRNSGTSSDLYYVIFDNNIYVALGWYDIMEDGVAIGKTTLFESVDGITWMPVSPGTISYFSSIAYGNGKFVAVGDNIISSTDAMNWKLNTFQPPERMKKVIYANGSFVAIGLVTTIYQSASIQ